MIVTHSPPNSGQRWYVGGTGSLGRKPMAAAAAEKADYGVPVRGGLAHGELEGEAVKGGGITRKRRATGA